MALEAHVGTVEDRATELMRSDPALFGWLVALGAGSGHWPAPVTDGATEDTAVPAPAPGPPGLLPGLLLAHGGRAWAVHTVNLEGKNPYRVEDTVFVWVSVLLARTAEDEMDPFV